MRDAWLSSAEVYARMHASALSSIAQRATLERSAYTNEFLEAHDNTTKAWLEYANALHVARKEPESAPTEALLRCLDWIGEAQKEEARLVDADQCLKPFPVGGYKLIVSTVKRWITFMFR